MPKRLTPVKSSSEPVHRRGLTHSSATEKTHALDSVECSTRLSTPLVSSTASSSSCSFASLSVTRLEMETFEGSCNASRRQQTPQHDVLFEYVKGLQEANRALDVDVAERVMQELAESLTSPAAAAMVVSSGGAHLIASAVKQFKAHGMQKDTANRGKGSKAGSKASSTLKASYSETNGEAEAPLQGKLYRESAPSSSKSDHQQRGDTNDLLSVKEVQLEDGPPSNVVSTSNEARRKRQRTSDELLEFEDYRSECHCKGITEMYSSSLLIGETRADKDIQTGATSGNPLKCASSEFPSLSMGSHRDVDDYTGSLKNNLCSKWVELVKSKVNGPKQRTGRSSEVPERKNGCEKADDDALTRSVNNQLDAEDIFINMSKKFGDVSRTLLEAMVDEVCESRPSSCRNAELEATIVSRLQGIAASVQSLPLGSSSQCKVVLTKQEDFLNNSKLTMKARYAAIKGKTKEKSSPSFCNGEVFDLKQKKSFTAAGKSGSFESLGGQSNTTAETALDTIQQTELQKTDRSKHYKDPCKSTSKVSHKKDVSMSGLENSTRDKKGIVCGEECRLHINMSCCKVKEEMNTALPSVLNLAKEAGFPDVVAIGCHALDKLINAALQSKSVPPANNMVTVAPTSSRRRGKVLTAELYVALTEALVEIVQVLKDQVDLLCWCLDCLGSILPPTSLNRAGHDGLSSSACSGLDTFFSCKDLLHANVCKGKKTDEAASGKQMICEHGSSQSSAVSARTSKAACTVEMPSKLTPKSSSDVLSLDTALTSTKSVNGLGPSLCSSISSGSASSSISALAAVAYTATVPMLAEKAVRAILSAIQPCDIEPQSTQAALHALSAHLSSINSKYICDDVVTFIIAAMREFKSDAEMQKESCNTLSALNRAISSATGHCAWSTIMDTMNTHCTNIVVQRAGCSALHVLCTRAGLGVLEWGSGRRPERASKDSDREAGVEATVSAMLLFPDDVRIQWHGCSALWTLVHSAGTRTVANMFYSGALCAVIGAMRVCRTNEVMQQEGCNVIGTMARMLVESGLGFGCQSTLDEPESPVKQKSTDRRKSGNDNRNKMATHGTINQRERSSGLSEEWWQALKVVVIAMKAFRKSKSVQNNGVFALCCLLKGSMDMSSIALSPASVPATSVVSSDVCTPSSKASIVGNGTLGGDEGWKEPLSRPCTSLHIKQPESKQADTLPFFWMGALEDIERLNEAVEVTMAAMPEFPRVETVQIWGCAVLQQVFLAYVHYSKWAMAISPTGSAASCPLQGEKSHKSVSQATRALEAVSHPSALANLVLSQATSCMFMISGMMALSCNGSTGDQEGSEKSTLCCDSRVATKTASNKPTGMRFQSSQTNQSLTSVRQSWCAALGAIGDVFGHLTQSTEVSAGKSFPKMTNALDMRAMMNASDLLNAETFTLKRNDVEPTAKRNDQLKKVEDRFLDVRTGSLSVEYPSSSRQLSSAYYLKAKSGKQCPSSRTWPDAEKQVLAQPEWVGKDDISEQKVINGIKAWQESTESLAKIAERVGFPMSVKNAILAIRTILYKLEDPETVIWACHALVSLYLTWENVHLFKPGLENNREEYKARIWGEGDVGVRQLVYLVSHWTKQSRMDVMSFALQALHDACMFAATVREIEEVFAPADCGIEAVLGAMQKVQSSGGTLSQRRKVVQQACCVLTEVCGYSIPVQVGFATAGGADIILSALDRFDDDNDVLVNGLNALGLDTPSQADFNHVWTAVINKSGSINGVRGSRRKKGVSSFIISLCHVFKEGAVASSNVAFSSFDGKGVSEETFFESEPLGIKFSRQLERLVFDGTLRLGRFLTWLAAGPGCGGPAFCAEVLRRLNSRSQKQSDMQSQMCLIIAHMSTHCAKWREKFLSSCGLEAVLACTKGLHFSGDEKPWSLPMCINGVEEILYFECSVSEKKSEQIKMKNASRKKKNGEHKCTESSMGDILNNHMQYAACIALTGLIGDQRISNQSLTDAVIKVLVLALHHYGGLPHLDLHIPRVGKVLVEFCASVRSALARLGVSRVGDSKSKQLAHEAAEVGDLLSLEALVQKNVDVTSMDVLGCTPLWYAEQSGQAKAAQFLREQEQLSGRRRAREKAKLKCKHGSSTGDSQLAYAQVIDTDLQLSQGPRDVPQPTEESVERKLPVLQERNSHEIQICTAEQAKENSRNMCAKENFISEAGSLTGTVTQELEDLGSLQRNNTPTCPCPHDMVSTVPETVKKKHPFKKKSKANKNFQASQQSLQDQTAIHPGPEKPHAVFEETLDDLATKVVDRTNKVKDAEVLMVSSVSSDGGAESSTNDASFMSSRAKNSRSEHSNEMLHEALLSGLVDHTNKMKDAKALMLSSVSRDGDGVEGSTTDASVVSSRAKNSRSEHSNKLLYEALLSGLVENLEAALQVCEDPKCGADDMLLKKVRAALVKRLKRAEKSAVLEKELASAVEERSCSQLLSAIMAIENVPRFAVAFSKKLTAARSLLLEIEAEERSEEQVDASKSVISSSAAKGSAVDLVPSDSERGAGGGPCLLKERVKSGKKDGEGLLAPRKKLSVAEGTKSGNERLADRRGESALPGLEITRNDCSDVRNECRRDRVVGGSGNSKGLLQTQFPLKSQAFSTYQRHEYEKASQNIVSCSSGSTQAVSAFSYLHERPQLLPTPQVPEIALPLLESVSCSVIQPPRHRHHSTKSLEQNPITPQLFSASQGTPFGYTYQETPGGKNDVSDGGFSIREPTVRGSEVGPFHISQLFPPCSSPQLFSSANDTVCCNLWPLEFLSENGTSVQNFGSSIPHTKCAHSTGGFMPSSTTLFSSRFGESHQSSCSAVLSGRPYETLPLPSSQLLSPLFTSGSESNVGSLPTFVQQALSCTCDDDFGQDQQGSAKVSSWVPSSVPGFSEELPKSLTSSKQNQQTSKPSGVACYKENIGQLNLVNQDFQHLSQALLQQATLSDASIGVPCCACFDGPKDATIISCGHQMCKRCAEEMDRLHNSCPVCNRMIETVLALCT